jgi:hypothetical protein
MHFNFSWNAPVVTLKITFADPSRVFHLNNIKVRFLLLPPPPSSMPAAAAGVDYDRHESQVG